MTKINTARGQTYKRQKVKQWRSEKNKYRPIWLLEKCHSNKANVANTTGHTIYDTALFILNIRHLSYLYSWVKSQWTFQTYMSLPYLLSCHAFYMRHKCIPIHRDTHRCGRGLQAVFKRIKPLFKCALFMRSACLRASF